MYSLSPNAIMDDERSIPDGEDDEFVWDGFLHAEDLNAISDNDDYQNLMFAARAGQKLLQRNGELRAMNFQLQHCKKEQRSEIQHLAKQLTWLREVTESKQRMIEQHEFNQQDLETSNRTLKAETKQWRERSTKYRNLCECREDEIQTLKAEIQALRKAQEKKVTSSNARRRTIHDCYSLARKDEMESDELSKSISRSSEFLNKENVRKQSNSSYLLEIETLRQVIGSMKVQQSVMHRKNEELQEEVKALRLENHDCCAKLLEERETVQKLNRIIEDCDKIVQPQQIAHDSYQDTTVDLCNKELFFLHGTADDVAESSHIDRDVLTQYSEANSTFNLSPTLNSQVPMSQYLQLVSSTPAKAPPIHRLFDSQSIDGKQSHCDIISEPRNVSLLQEMDTQYKSLMGKYETLLETIESEQNSSSSDGSRHDTKSKTQSNTSNSSSGEQKDGNSSKIRGAGNVPEYKRLFRKIFTLINEAKV